PRPGRSSSEATRCRLARVRLRDIVVVFALASALVGGALALPACTSKGRAGAAATGPLALRPEGERFRLSLTQELASAGGQPKRVRIEGTWQSVRAKKNDGGREERAFRLVDVHVSADTGAAPIPEAD